MKSNQKKFEWGKVKVQVTWNGPGPSPIDEHRSDKRLCMHYAVEVSMGHGVLFLTDAWGSIAEYERWQKTYGRSIEHLDLKSMGAMVVDELASALSDPDEFLTLVQGDLKGPAALEKLKQGERTILAAARFGEQILSEAVDKIREEGLL